MFIQILFCFSAYCTPLAQIESPNPSYSLINSVDFHPHKNLFCTTFTHANSVSLYQLDLHGLPSLVQTLTNPTAELSEPQHAIFSADGKQLFVANWKNETVTIYQVQKNGLYSAQPLKVCALTSEVNRYKPHGIAISPCGGFLAVAFGTGSDFGRAVALYGITDELELVSVLNETELEGTPKGIAFSPDGRALLVTFCDLNSLQIFDVDTANHRISSEAAQTLSGDETGIFRPEDVKISPDGKLVALSNSDHDTVTFYPFDAATNRVTQSRPCAVLQSPVFPHGLAFSPDGSFFAVTQFGPILFNEIGNVIWGKLPRPEQAKVQIYKVRK